MAENAPDPQRRKILRATLWGGGLAGIGALAGLTAKRLAGDRSARARPPLGPEFTYDVSRFQTTDPALVRWRELVRFPSGFARPRNLRAAADGSVLVCGDGGVRRFDPQGNETASIPLDGPVHAVAELPDGSLLAARPERLTLIGTEGGQRADWPVEGALPVSLAVGEGRVFVGDARRRIVRVLDPEGRPLDEIGGRDEAAGIEGFVVPSPYFTVRAAPDGLLRVANPGKQRIEAWTTGGRFELAWGRPSYAIDGFCGCCNPVSFDLLPDGGFVTGEKGLPRVKTYDSHGAFTGVVAGPEAFPEYLQAARAGLPATASAGILVAADAAGRVLILDTLGGTVRIMIRKEDGDG